MHGPFTLQENACGAHGPLNHLKLLCLSPNKNVKIDPQPPKNEGPHPKDVFGNKMFQLWKAFDVNFLEIL